MLRSYDYSKPRPNKEGTKDHEGSRLYNVPEDLDHHSLAVSKENP